MILLHELETQYMLERWQSYVIGIRGALGVCIPYQHAEMLKKLYRCYE